ncbi:hypothetical protein VTN77DRAFT_350 [Rasamsonia byssochlamydoides]|uniref:uncharacterized protein n=1 Tax=Rasamsonia byssochlamydoides TaxID=89139 RepID=UPI003743C1B1
MRSAKPTIEFVTEPRSLLVGSDIGASLSSDSWKSVDEQQADLIKLSNAVTDRPATGVPFWTLAEAGKSTLPQSSQSYRAPLRQSVIHISAMGEDFISSLTTKLPVREDCNRFFEHFCSSIYPVVPVVHLPTLRDEYSEFWMNL